MKEVMVAIIIEVAIAISATAIKVAIATVAMLAVGQSNLLIKKVGFIVIMLRHTIIELTDSFKEVSRPH